MITKSSGSGFSLVELLVVVAIIGFLSAIGFVSYNGYVSSSKKSAAKNVMQSVSLAQSEYYSNQGDYYYTEADGGTCLPDHDRGAYGSGDSSTDIETRLFAGGDLINEEMSFDMCVEKLPGGYLIKGIGTFGDDTVNITLNHNGSWGP